MLNSKIYYLTMRFLSFLGEAQAKNRMGYFYEEGIHVKQSYEKAAKYYLQSAKWEIKEAQANIGRLYQYGLGVEQDFSQARAWFEKAAENGHPWAQNGLATLCSQGLGGEKDIAKAVYWYEKAANEHGYAWAQQSLGWIYSEGIGVESDHEKAMEWYKKAADQGLPQAQYNLALMYINDKGGNVDKTSVRNLLEKAYAGGVHQAKEVLNSI